MGWDRGYYYRSRKVGGRPRRVYVGKGRAAELAAELDALRRVGRQVRLEDWRDARAEVEALDQPLDELGGMADLLAEAALFVAGYRQHHRGEWRKRRVQHDQPGRPDEAGK
jgi:hypothetical protein